MYFENLRDNLFAEVKYPAGLSELMTHTKVWRAFCDLPLSLKERFVYPEHESVWDLGYKMRKRSLGREDKEYFHYTPKNVEFLSHYKLTGLVSENKTVANFFSFGDALYRATRDLALEIGRDLGKHLPTLPEELEKGKDMLTLRFLHYTPEKADDLSLADAHFDRSGFTLHLYESHPGLQLLDWNLQWKDASIREGSTVMFTGYQLELLSKGVLQKTWHRVVRKKEALGNDSRVSVVLFVPFVDTPTYPKEARAQDQIPSYIRL